MEARFTPSGPRSRRRGSFWLTYRADAGPFEEFPFDPAGVSGTEHRGTPDGNRAPTTTAGSLRPHRRGLK
jgi:hypothetical protein